MAEWEKKQSCSSFIHILNSADYVLIKKPKTVLKLSICDDNFFFKVGVDD